MSATIYYRKLDKADPHLKTVGSPSTFIEVIQELFGDLPCTLTRADVLILRGAEAARKGIGFKELADIIESVGPVEIYAKH